MNVFVLESDEFDDIPVKLNNILKEVSNDVEYLPELQVSFYKSIHNYCYCT